LDQTHDFQKTSDEFREAVPLPFLIFIWFWFWQRSPQWLKKWFWLAFTCSNRCYILQNKYKYDILEIITKNNKNNKITTKNVNYRKMRLRDKW